MLGNFRGRCLPLTDMVPLLQTIAMPYRIGKSTNSLRHVLRGRCRIRGPEEHLCRGPVVLGPEPRTSAHEDAFLDAEIEYLFFNVEDAAMRCIRVEVVVDL